MGACDFARAHSRPAKFVKVLAAFQQSTGASDSAPEHSNAG
ncbi:MAG: hypothetical protein ABL955_01615 [Elusimicrobiota bacterium]